MYLVVNNITPILNVTQQLTILLAFLFQNPMKDLEMLLRKDLDNNNCSALVAAPSTLGISGMISSLQAFTNVQCHLLIVVPEEAGSSCANQIPSLCNSP